MQQRTAKYSHDPNPGGFAQHRPAVAYKDFGHLKAMSAGGGNSDIFTTVFIHKKGHPCIMGGLYFWVPGLVLAVFFICSLIGPVALLQASDHIKVCHDLVQAIKTDNLEVLRDLIDSGASPNQECLTKTYLIDDAEVSLTLLIIATEKGNIEIIDYLINGGADMEKSVSIQRGDQQPFTLKNTASNEDGAPIINLYEFTYTPLLAAMMTRQLEVMEFLLSRGAMPDEIYTMDMKTNRCLRNPESPNKASGVQYVALMMAKYLRDVKMIVTLLEWGAKPEDQKLYGRTCVPVSAYHALNFIIINGGTIEDVARVLKLGIDQNVASKSSYINSVRPLTPLYLAVSREDIDMVKFLLNNGAKLDLKDPFGRDLQTLYFATSCNKSTDMIRYLKSLGVKPHERRSSDQTPISMAIYCANESNFAVLKEMLELGWDLEKTNISSYTVLQLAAKSSKTPPIVLEMLIKAGADVNHPHTALYPDRGSIESEGRVTPLMFALNSRLEPYETVKILLENGARADLKTGEGGTALDIWQKKMNSEITRKYNDQRVISDISDMLERHYKKDVRKAALKKYSMFDGINNRMLI